MPAKRKWTYWHQVTWVNPDPVVRGNFKKGEVVGWEDRETEVWGLDPKNKGFAVMARLRFLGKAPLDLHKTDPAKCTELIEGWLKKMPALAEGS